MFLLVDAEKKHENYSVREKLNIILPRIIGSSTRFDCGVVIDSINKAD